MDIKNIINEMTLEEKAFLVSGKNMWNTEAIERVGIPGIFMCDGPHGLRKQEHREVGTNGIYDSIDAVVNIGVLVELLGIGLTLILISSISAMISIQRFTPLTILKERS